LFLAHREGVTARIDGDAVRAPFDANFATMASSCPRLGSGPPPKSMASRDLPQITMSPDDVTLSRRSTGGLSRG
jgi:hypothetical protein